jgi:transcriptional regulator with XRE-family HTH domain
MALAADTALRNIGRRIAELRTARGYTQQAAADRLKCTARYVQAVEAGRVNLSVRALVDWANLVRAPLAALVARPLSRARRRPGRPPKAPRAR